VFTTIDGGSTWNVEDTGFANVVVDSLSITSRSGANNVYAFTHGRGAWRAPIVVPPPTISKAFGASSIALSGSTSLSFTINNPNSGIALSGIAFTDALPAGLVVATPNGLTGSCGGGTITATAGSGSLSLSGATLAASASCTFSVNVTGTTAGSKANTTGAISATESGTGATSNTATLKVVAPPTISKAFSAGTIPLNGTATVTFTISNANVSTTLTGVGFSDTLPSATGTLVVSNTPNVANTCGGTVTAAAGAGSISLSGGTVNQSASCTLSVDVKGTAVGDASNTTGAITSTEGGTGTASNTATIKIVAPPTISKAFGAASILLNGTTTATFTITNPAANTTAESGIAFSDTLTNGLQVAGTPGVSNSCGGTVTAAAASTSISLAGGSIATPGATCVISVNVTGTLAGTVSNTTGSVSSTNGGTGAGSNTATLKVIAPPTIAKAFGTNNIPLSGTTSLTFTLGSPAANPDPLTGIAFSDSLPAGLVVATPNGLAGNCLTVAGAVTNAASVTAVAGSSSVSMSTLGLTSGGSCTFTVNVTGSTTGAKNNTTGNVTSANGGTGGTGVASIVVGPAADISVILTHAPDPAAIGGRLTFTATVVNHGPDTANVTFTENFTGAQYLVSANSTLGGSCLPGEPVNCSVTMTNGQSATITVVVTPLLGRNVVANATVTPDIPDQDSSNNNASSTGRVRFKPQHF
jgi:hypothetical protein